MRKILAVSGGVDSVVMLHLLRGERPVVAHFNHGIRGNAGEDEDFVRRKAEEYGLDFVVERGDLGSGASEAEARLRRYAFLGRVAKKMRGEIYVAHHRDDLVEGVVINLLRGTGWRGLAPFGNERIRRPLLSWNKAEIYEYATKNELRFRQDQSNSEEEYLRNRVRRQLELVRLEGRGEVLKNMVDLAERQMEVRGEVDRILDTILPEGGRYEREWFREMDDGVAMEILRAGLLRVGRRATRPQLRDFLGAVRDYAVAKSFNLPGDYLVRFAKDSFVLK